MVGQAGDRAATTALGAIAFDALFEASPNPYVLLDRAFTIVWMNDAYLAATGRQRDEILGRNMFDAFPSDPRSESGRQLRDSLRRVLRDRVRDHIPLIQYDIAGAGGTVLQERFWSATHTPLPDADGEVALILQHTVDVTELHRLRRAAPPTAQEATVSAQVEGSVLRHARHVEESSRALARERDRLRRLFEQAPGFMAVLEGPQHVFVLANAAYADLVGHREIIGRPVRDALPDVVDQEFPRLLDEVYASGRPYVGRGERVLLRSGPGRQEVEHVLDFVYQPILDAGGAVAGIFVQGHDLTEQKRAERALQESEQRFRLVAEGAPVMLWMTDAAGRALYLNKAQREFWGRPPVEPPQEDGPSFDWRDNVHPDDREAMTLPVRQAVADRSGFTTEGRVRRADGEYRILRVRAEPRFDADGRFAGFTGVNADITEQHRAEARRQEETRALEVLNRTGATIAAELDLDRLVGTVTDAGVELTGARFGAFFYNVLDDAGASYMLYSLSGAPEGAFQGYPMPRATDLFGPTFRGEGIVRSDDVLQDPRYGRNPPHRGMPPGHLPVRSYLAVPVRSRSGEVLGGLFFGHPDPGIFDARAERLLTGLAAQAAVAIDNARLFQAAEREIAQRRRAEEALQALNASLEQQVAERTAQLRRNEEALRQAQKMEAVGELTGGVAHDFNNLLQVIGGSLQLLARELGDNERAAQRLQSALAGVSRGSRLASQLLAFGRRQPLAPKVVDLARLLHRLDDMLRQALGEEIEVRVKTAPGLWKCFVDPAQVENALLNLVINARDAIDGAGRVAIEADNAILTAREAARSDTAPGDYVMLSVADNGRGMTAEVAAQAVEPFFTTKPEGQGTGLGLSQVYGFVKQSGGHVRICSAPGEGARITLFLPRTDAEEEAEAPEADSAPAGTARGETVLVVEDDAEVRSTVSDLVADLGYRVLQAQDADSALAILESGAAIDLLFTDVIMPGTLRSTELARRARQLLPGIAVLFTSGYTEGAIVHGGRLDDGVDLLSKPYGREELARRMRQALQRRVRPAPSAPEPPAAPDRHAQGPAPAPPARLRVLLVEDEVLIRLSTADMLAELGHEVVEAGSGAEALAALESGRIDLLLADLGLPDMTGGELAEAAARRRPGLRIVFATGRSAAPALAADVPAGRTALLVKPYDERRLAAALQQVFG